MTSRGRGGDHCFGDCSGIDQHEIGTRAHRQPVAEEAAATRGLGCDARQRPFQFVVAAQRVAQPDMHGAIQHVRPGIGGPGITDAVIAAEHGHAGGTAGGERWHRAGGRRGGGDRHLEACHSRQQRIAVAVGDAPEAEAMADHNFALHAEGRGALQDQVEGEGAHFPRLVQVDVDRPAVAARQGEGYVKAVHRIAVDRARVDAADDVGTLAQGGVHQRLGTGTVGQAGLREGDDLHLHRICQRVARLHGGVQMGEADVGIEIGMGSHARCAIGEEVAGQGERARGGIMARCGAPGTLILDAVEAGGTDLVAIPGTTPEGLVEMGMAFDQARQKQRSRPMLGGNVLQLRHVRTDGGDRAVAHQYVRDRGTERTDIPDQQVWQFASSGAG